MKYLEKIKIFLEVTGNIWANQIFCAPKINYSCRTMQKNNQDLRLRTFFYKSLLFWDRNYEIRDRFKMKKKFYLAFTLNLEQNFHIRELLEEHTRQKSIKFGPNCVFPQHFFGLYGYESSSHWIVRAGVRK